MSADPRLVREAVRRGLRLEEFIADRSQPARPFIEPRQPPPPERLTLIRTPDGSLAEPRQVFTRHLIADRVVDPAVVIVARHTEEPS